MGIVGTPVANLRILACSAACLYGGLWIAACGSTKSSVNDETSGTSPSSDGTSNTSNTQSATNSSAGGAASSASNGNAGGNTPTGDADAGGASSNGTSDGGDGGSTGSDTSSGSGGSGGSTETTTGMGGSVGTGGSAAGGATNTGGAGGSGGSTATNGGSAGANGGSAGTGGTPGECPGPIPFGGPREDGPQSINETCAQIDDDVILDRYHDTDAKVPQGLYYEQPGSVSWWEAPCSESLEDTVDRIGDRAIGEIQSQVATDWSYTVVGCADGAHRFYNNLRCDYFDGSTLDGSSAEDLAFLASLLWWMERGNLTGAQILGYTESAGGATDMVAMCTIRTTFGDFGLCDQITLERTQYSITVSGSVTIGDTETLRTIEGDCN